MTKGSGERERERERERENGDEAGERSVGEQEGRRVRKGLSASLATFALTEPNHQKFHRKSGFGARKSQKQLV